MDKPFRELTQADLDGEKEGCAHLLVAVGHLGSMMVFMDQDLETIRRRFAAEFYGDGEIADPDEQHATVHGFDDVFEVYELRT